MKIKLFLFSLLFLIGAASAAASDDVKITAKAVEDTVRAGKEVQWRFHLQPREGLHINVEPAIKLTLVEAKNFNLAAEKFTPDSTNKTIATNGGYKIFDPLHMSPVIFTAKVAKDTKPGRYPVKAKLTYYYCSDLEGWCRFENEEFVFVVVVVK